MIRTNTSQFKARLGQYLRAAREGQEVVVLDRSTPVARLLPFNPPSTPASVLVSTPRSPGAPPFAKLRIVPVRRRGTNTTRTLREDRSLR